MNVVFCDKRDCVFCDVDGICNCVMHDGIPYCKSEIWDENLSHDYDGKRFVVDGDIIELFAYEYGRRQTGVAEQFHAEPLEAYESRWLHDWTEHHDNMLRRTCDALESENTKLKDFVYDMWNDMNVYHVQHESPDSSDMDFYRDRMREIGIEVSE